MNVKMKLMVIYMTAASIVYASNAKEQVVQNPLDGKKFSGEVRAKGIYGLVGVTGELEFYNGQLIWKTKDSLESGDYHVIEQDGIWHFSSRYTIENDEGVYWSGTFDGNTLDEVEIIWSRQPGDWVHDLLLPKQLKLSFTVK